MGMYHIVMLVGVDMDKVIGLQQWNVRQDLRWGAAFYYLFFMTEYIYFIGNFFHNMQVMGGNYYGFAGFIGPQYYIDDMPGG